MSRDENSRRDAVSPYPETEPAAARRGFVLLVAGVGLGRRKKRALEDSEAALAGWVGLPPQILIADAPADVVQLPAGSGPQTVRGYLERASVTRGPVVVYVTGHLMPDRRGELHLTLRDSSPGSVRYDGLPWAWIAETLRIRDPRDTLVVADLTASDDVRARVHAAPEELAARLPLWAVVAPPPSSHDEPAHAFTRTLTVAARRGFLGCPAQVEVAAVHPSIFGRAQLPDGTVQIVPPEGGALRLANRLPVDDVSTEYVVTVTRPDSAPAPSGDGAEYPAPTGEPFAAAPPAGAAPSPPPSPAPQPGPSPVERAPETSHLRVTWPVSPAPAPAAEPMPDGPPQSSAPSGAPQFLRRAAELRAAMAAGNFDAAFGEAEALTHDMETRYGLGPEHRETIEALQTWAWLAARTGRIGHAVRLYTESARRNARVHGPGHPATQAAADAAHTLWLQVADVATARELGPAVVALRGLVLGRGPHSREAAAAHLAELAGAAEAAASAPIPAPPQPPTPTPPYASTPPPDAAPATPWAPAPDSTPPRAPGPHSGPSAAPGPTSARPAPAHGAPPEPARESAPEAHGETAPTTHRSTATVPASTSSAAPVSHAAPDAEPLLDDALPPPPELREALDEIADTAADGRYTEALGAADAVIAALVADLGPCHVHTLNVREIRAYLAAEAERLPEAVAAYLDIAEDRMTVGGPEHPDTVSAVDNAHVLWLRLPDGATATAAGHRLVALRTRVPGPGGRALEGALARMDELTSAPPPTAGEPPGAPTAPATPDGTEAPEASAPTAPEPPDQEGQRERPEPPAPHDAADRSGEVPAFPGSPATGPDSTPAEPPASSATTPSDSTTPPSAAPAEAPAPAAAGPPSIPAPPVPAPRAPVPTHASEPPRAAQAEPPGTTEPPQIPIAQTGSPAQAPAAHAEARSTPQAPPPEFRAYLTAIKAATAADNHVEALTLAEELTRGVEAKHGPGHPHTLNAYEVRAHLTASAGLFATAARQYAALAQRLADARDPADPGACSAADAAQALWLRLGSTDAARHLGPGIVDLRRRVPGPDGLALDAARVHLSVLIASDV
ncbi:hypothetical protein GCM10023205_21510 [Yinghuangia aomiensis]|uniref:Tetratricopeptide repeat-containing protein n=1 Tax=Yinghuangia aomiensis TaxID=676205 RepID=A0ABP9H0S9_9ACTN